MFDIIGSIIGVLVVFHMGVWVGGKYYDQYVAKVKLLVEKVKALFKRNNTN